MPSCTSCLKTPCASPIGKRSLSESDLAEKVTRSISALEELRAILALTEKK